MMIPIKQLTRALVFVGDDPTRFYLSGVHVVCSGSHLRLEATDGHIAYVWGAPATDETSFDVIVPADALKAGIKVAGKRAQYVAVSAPAPGRVRIGDVELTAIDGTFPDLRRVLPVKTSGHPAGFNPVLLARVAKALGRNGLLVFLNGGGPAIAAGDDDEIVVVMPHRDATPISEPTDFAARIAAAYGDAI
jgi:hypothetical protein